MGMIQGISATTLRWSISAFKLERKQSILRKRMHRFFDEVNIAVIFTVVNHPERLGKSDLAHDVKHEVVWIMQ